MKKYLVLILGVVLFACSQKQTGFNIDVKLDGAEGQILLEQRENGGMVAIDTADIVDGVAILEGEVPYPAEYYLSVVGQRPKTMIFIENAKMSIVGKADSLKKVVVTGSPTHDEYASLVAEVNVIVEEYMGLVQESRAAIAAGDTTRGRELMDRVTVMYESTNTFPVEFVKKNPASYVSPFLLEQIQQDKEVEELEAMVIPLDPKLDSIPSIIQIKKRIAKLKTVAVGQIAPDFTQNDIDGNPIKFSDIYSQNELTLLDFWAAWCGPCRAENPNVVAVYNEYKAKGFTVFGVSLDREKTQWVKAVADDKLAWTQVSDLSYWQNEVAQTYAIQSIPSSLLVDKNGMIVAKNKRGDDLKDFVAETLD